MHNKDKPRKTRSNPGGAPPLRVYVSSNGEGKPVRIDGKLSARMVEDFKHIEWTHEIKNNLTLVLILRKEKTPFTNQIINRGWAKGYFSLQGLRNFLPLRIIEKIKTPEFTGYTDFPDGESRTLAFKIPLDKPKHG